MSILYREKNRFLIRDISNSSIACYLDPVLSIVIKLINAQNENFIQFIGETNLLTNDIKKVIELLDIRVGFFKAFIQTPIVQSKYGYYNTFEAFMLCRMIRDFSLIGEEFTIKEKINLVKDGEEIAYKEMKKLRISYNMDKINISQIVNFSELIEDVYNNYIASHLDLFLKDRFHLHFVNIKSSFYDFQAFNDSYALEISDRNLVQNQFTKTKEGTYIQDIILCDFSPSYLQFKKTSATSMKTESSSFLLVISSAVMDEQEIDSFYSLSNILIICNISLKVLRELSFLFSLKVHQSANDISLIGGDQISESKNKFLLRALYRQNIEFNRRESELFHLKNRIPLLIQSISKSDKKQIISTVISVPSSLSHKQQALSSQILKQFQKLRNILQKKKIALGGGRFEKSISSSLKQYLSSNPYLLVLSQALSDYSAYLQKNQLNCAIISLENTKTTTEQIPSVTEFYDDYSQKKRILQKINMILKQKILTTLEMQYEVQKKE